MSLDSIRHALECSNPHCSCHKGLNAHCPAHEDREPSLTLHEKDGRVLWNCKKGCDQKAVGEALKARGLWPPVQDRHNGDGSNGRSGDYPVATYEYRDAAGELVAIKARFESGVTDPATGKSKKLFKWRLPDKDKWSLDGTPISDLPLWGADLVGLASPDERVYLVEGEKAALACRAMGLLAVTHPGGASTTNFGASLEVLRGRHVVLWPDNDDAGRKLMDRIRTALHSIARSVVTIFPSVPEKGDAVEFFGGGATVDDLQRLTPLPPRPVLEFLSTQETDGCRLQRCGLGYQAAIEADRVTVTLEHLRRSSGELRGEVLVECQIPSIPNHLYWGSLILSSGANREKLAKTLENRTKGLGIDWDGILEVVCRKIALAERQGEPFTTAGDMQAEQQATDWAINGFAPRLEPTTIYGDGGVGKSMLTLALAIGVKAGVEIVPGFSPIVQGGVLYLDWEASRQRIDTRVKRICQGAGIQPVTIGYRRCSVPLVDQVEEVLRYCQSEGVVLVVVDSVEMAMNGTGGQDGNPNDKVIVLHSALRMLGVTSILVDHISAAGRSQSGGAGKPIGGVYKTNLARMAFELRKGEPSAKPGIMEIGLFNAKRNDDGAPLKPIGLRAIFDDDSTRYERDSITDAGLLAGMPPRDRVIAALKHGPLPNKAIADASGLSASHLSNVLKQNPDCFVKLPTGAWALATSDRDEAPDDGQDIIPF